MHRRRSKIPDERLLVARQERETANLVPLPLADFRGGDVTDVIDVEQQQSAALRRLQRVLGAGEAVAPQAVVIHTALEIHGGVAERWNMPIPSPIRIGVRRPQDARAKGRELVHKLTSSC